jgi:cysteine desulfurase
VRAPVETQDSPAYFDAAAAAPLHPVARQALQAALDDGWADPGKVYRAGRLAHHLLEAARAAVADTLAVRPDEVSFCAGGTEACHRAVAGLIAGRERVGRAVVHSAVEHSAILNAASALASETVSVPVDRLGRVLLPAWRSAVAGKGVVAAALMSANHEVGTVQPIANAAAACWEENVPLIVDAAQTIGRMSVPTGWSVLTGSARKWGGPAGVGLLVVRAGTRFTPARLAAAEVSLPLVVAAAAALRAVAAEASAEDARLRQLVERVRSTVSATVPDVDVVGDPVDRLPNLVTFSCLYVDGEALLNALDKRGFAVSSGSSCTSSTLRPSHVLEAMGVLSHGNVRVSLHRESTAGQVDRFLAELPGIVAELRAQAGVSGL